MSSLVPEKAFNFRIVHVDCLAWILTHGLHCKNSSQQDPNYINIGNRELIAKRATKPVPIAPGDGCGEWLEA